MESPAITTAVKNRPNPNLAPINQPNNLSSLQITSKISVELLLQKNRQKFDQHVARLTELEQLITVEERMIADCLAEEKHLLSLLEQKLTKAS